MHCWLVNQHVKLGLSNWLIRRIFLINLVQLVWGQSSETHHSVCRWADLQHEWNFSILFFQTNVGTISESPTQITSLHPVIRCLTTRLRNAHGWLQLQDRTRGFWSTSTHTLTWKTESASKCSLFSVEVRHLLALIEHLQDVQLVWSREPASCVLGFFQCWFH